MSNPFLRPGDPRFQRPELRDENGKNRFADANPAAEESTRREPFAATSDGAERPFLPQYEQQQSSRTGLVQILGAAGWLGASLGFISLTGLYDSGWICPLLGMIPAASSWLLGRQDLAAIEVGAMDPTAYRATRRGHWLGLTAFIFCLAATIGMIVLNRGFLPENL